MHVDWLICQSKMGLRMFNLKRKEFKKSANFQLATTQFNCLYLKEYIINIKELFGLKYLHSCSQKYPRTSHSFYCLADKQIILVESALCRFVLFHFRYSLILNMHPYRKTQQKDYDQQRYTICDNWNFARDPKTRSRCIEKNARVREIDISEAQK